MMEQYTYLIPCHFGTESVLKNEIYDLGYEITRVDDGRVTFTGDAEAMAYANIHVRSGERVLLVVGQFMATTFDEYFEGIKALPWEEFIPQNGRFWIKKASSVKSKLFSPSDLQSLGKKAMVDRLSKAYGIKWFEETGDSYPVRVFLNKDEVTVALDTTGESLHKRGYRTMVVQAPIEETLASALIKLTPWRGDRILVDPFCGSGTIPIESAMMAANIAPGAYRSFLSEAWRDFLSPSVWKAVREEAKENENRQIETDIQGYDIDPDAIKAARENAKRAGVDHLIHFQQREVARLSHPKKYGFIITNPPYGERLSEKKELPPVYGALGEAYRGLDSWSMYLITSYELAERDLSLKAAKNRKIYNGMIKTYFYQFPGPKPPARKK